MEDIFVDHEKGRRSNCYNYRRMALQNLLRIIVCHYYLRCSYQLHGSVMATKSFLTCLNLQILRQKIYIAYVHNAMCGYVCFCPSRFFFSGRNRILHTLCKCSENLRNSKYFFGIRGCVKMKCPLGCSTIESFITFFLYKTHNHSILCTSYTVLLRVVDC